jgi:DnaJ-domain-containing protein 1
MPTLFLGLVLLVLLFLTAKWFSKAVRVLRYVGGGGVLLFAVFLLLRGQIAAALSIGLIGLGVLGYVSLWPTSFGERTQKTARRVSRVRTAFLEMELERDSRAMRGRVLNGTHQGAELDRLDVKTLIRLLGEMDDDSRRLLASYLDRREPEWREQATQGDTGEYRSGTPRNGKMTEEEAYQILGIRPGTSPEEIVRAHRSLIKKLHPDQGGSTYLAAKINEAKEVLVRRHR